MSTVNERKEIYSTRRWRRIRGDILERDGWQCTKCGQAKPDFLLEVHHVKPIREGGDYWEYENLATLCRACHRAAHNHNAGNSSQDTRRNTWNQLIADLL